MSRVSFSCSGKGKHKILPLHTFPVDNVQNAMQWGQSQFHVLTVSHGVAPWRWPKLYPDDWLQYVNEKHTHYTVEMRHIDGEFITQLDLKSRIYLHSHRDLAVMHFEEEDKALGLLKKLDLTTNLDFNCEDRLPADFSKVFGSNNSYDFRQSYSEPSL